MRLEKKTPREITNMDQKWAQKAALRLNKLQCQHYKKKISCKNSKVLSTKSHEYTRLLENNQSFNSIADFFVRLQR